MKCKITFFKDSGKYYSSGEFELKEGTFIWSDSFKQELVNTQNCLADGWQDHGYYVLVDGTYYRGFLTPEENIDSIEKNGFIYHLFKPGDFFGIKKEIV